MGWVSYVVTVAAQITAVVCVGAWAQELSHAAGVSKKKKKNQWNSTFALPTAMMLLPIQQPVNYF